MDDLITWLRAQLDDDERVAREAQAEAFGLYPDGHGDATLAFLNRFNEDRVLAEVDATRRILDELAIGVPDGDPDGWLGSIARLLALPYAGRPGYHEEWSPDGRM